VELKEQKIYLRGEMDYKVYYKDWREKSSDLNGVFPEEFSLSHLTEASRYLFHYADFGDLQMVKACLLDAADVNARMGGEKFTPIMFAAMKGHFNVCKFLIQEGVDILAKTSDSTPVIIWSVWNYGRVEIIKLLVEMGADINSIFKEEEKSVLTLACKNNNEKIALFLLEQGVDLFIPNKKRPPALYFARKNEMKSTIKVISEMIKKK
jgi:ankyrin repeat protein